jgi:hypothetical protein
VLHIFMVGAADGNEVVERVRAALLERRDVVDLGLAAAAASGAVDAAAVAGAGSFACLSPGCGVAGADSVAGRSSVP